MVQTKESSYDYVYCFLEVKNRQSESPLGDEVGKAQVSESVSYKGAVENRKGKLKNVTIGRISVDAPTVLFFGKAMGRDKEPWATNIGNIFLKILS